jgi:hypothetical protein
VTARPIRSAWGRALEEATRGRARRARKPEPPRPAEPPPAEPPTPGGCAWPPCPHEPLPGRHYCSRTCSRRVARLRYKQRQGGRTQTPAPTLLLPSPPDRHCSQCKAPLSPSQRRCCSRGCYLESLAPAASSRIAGQHHCGHCGTLLGDAQGQHCSRECHRASRLTEEGWTRHPVPLGPVRQRRLVVGGRWHARLLELLEQGPSELSQVLPGWPYRTRRALEQLHARGLVWPAVRQERRRWHLSERGRLVLAELRRLGWLEAWPGKRWRSVYLEAP